MVTKVSYAAAETVYIEHPESSYGIFCFNEVGDLFLNSDWGFYAYAWRSMGERNTKAFIAQTNKEYLAGKLSMNTNSDKRYLKTAIKHVENLCEELIKHCKETA